MHTCVHIGLCVRTYTYRLVSAYMCTYKLVHAYMCTYRLVCEYMCTSYRLVRAYMCTYRLVRAYMCTYRLVRAYMCTNTLVRAYMCTYTLVRAYMCTYRLVHAYMCLYMGLMRMHAYMCAYRLVHVYVWPCACVRIWGCACVRMGLCMRKRLCMPYTCTYYIHMYVLACMSSKFAYIFCKLVLNASMYLIQCKWTTYEVVCTSSWMVLKVFSMAVHILGKMAVVCACSGVGIKVRPSPSTFCCAY